MHNNTYVEHRKRQSKTSKATNQTTLRSKSTSPHRAEALGTPELRDVFISWPLSILVALNRRVCRVVRCRRSDEHAELRSRGPRLRRRLGRSPALHRTRAPTRDAGAPRASRPAATRWRLSGRTAIQPSREPVGKPSHGDEVETQWTESDPT